MKNIGVVYRSSLSIAFAVALLCNSGCQRQTASQHGTGQVATAQDKELQNRNLIDQVVQAAEKQENYPDPAYLRGALGRLNSWLAEKPVSEDFEADEEFSELADSFKALLKDVRRINELVNLFADETKTPTEADGTELQQLLEGAQKQTEELAQKTSSNALSSYALFFEDFHKQLASATEFQFADSTETLQTQVREFIKRPVGEFYNCAAFIEGLDAVQRLLVVDGKVFLPQDADFLREIVWMRDVFSWAKGSKQDDLTIVKSLFDWTLSNIVISEPTPGPAGPIAQLPWQTLLLSQGTAMDRAIVFIELLRQHRLDAFVIRPAEEKEVFPLVVGVRLNGEVYLFLPEYGLAIPGEGADALTLDNGLQYNSIATLSQVAKNDALLRRFDVADKPFPATASDFAKVVAYVPSTPFTVAARMLPMEQEFSGAVNTVVATPFNAQKARIAELDGIVEVKRLYEATAPIIEQAIFSFESEDLTQIYMTASANANGNLEVSDSNTQTDDNIADYTNSDSSQDPADAVSSTKKTQSASLWIGKNLYFRGQFTNDEGAGRQFLSGRISDRLIKQEETTIQQRVREYAQKYQEWRASQGEAATQEEVNAIAREAAATFQMEVVTKRYIKILTSYYLALLSEASGNDAAAMDRLNDDSLRLRPHANAERVFGASWRYAANYLRARILERQGNIETAIKRLQVEPNNLGYQVRAQWLAELTGVKLEAQPAAETVDEDAKETPETIEETVENSVEETPVTPEETAEPIAKETAETVEEVVEPTIEETTAPIEETAEPVVEEASETVEAVAEPATEEASEVAGEDL